MEAIIINPAIDIIPEWIYSEESPIQGTGAFARQNIKKGKKLFWNVPVMQFDEYKLLAEQLSAKHKEFFLTTQDAVYDIRDSVLRFMNHSHRPNIDWGDGYIIALADIQMGEELTINYGWDTYAWEMDAKAP